MLWGGQNEGLEIRTEGGATRLRASFPYGRETTLSEGGPGGTARKEVFAARAFAQRIEAGQEIHLLSGHDYEKPLASRSAGTLTLTDTDAALLIEAVITPAMAAVSYVADLLAALAAGLITGLSPGFRVAPTPGAETVEAKAGAILRTVRAAQLFEVSAVTRPAYPDAQIEARSWNPTQGGIILPDASQTGLHRTLSRWRL